MLQIWQQAHNPRDDDYVPFNPQDNAHLGEILDFLREWESAQQGIRVDRPNNADDDNYLQEDPNHLSQYSRWDDADDLFDPNHQLV